MTLDEYVPDEEEEEDSEEFIKKNMNNRKYYPQTVETALRYGLSNRVTAAMMNSLITDLEIDPGKHQLLSISKVRNLKIRQGYKLHALHEEISGYQYIGFDGSKSQALMLKNKWRVKDKNTIICQARRSYIDHFIPLSGQGVALANGVIEVGCDLMHLLQ